ncbi:helix-turn-helix domain-containing protein [Cupriavidus necator]|uniref:helix-turn-helix domain-containing protein n=1 Tax=Cupriavidus necator TaxID=106590 RepID=UPI0039C01CB2
MDMKLWIRLARKKAGLTQEQLAEKLGLTKGNISAWENGRHEASFAQLSAIAELSGLPLEYEAPVVGPRTLETWQIEDAARLKALYEERNGKFSQEEFGRRFEIGSQSMVWQYLNAQRPLNIKAATGFAQGLDVDIDAFSPRLADEIRRASSAIGESIWRAAAGSEVGRSLSDRLQLVMAEQKLSIDALAEQLAVETAVIRAWLEDRTSKLQLHHAVKIQEAYGYSPAWLINGKGTPKLANLQEAELDEASLSLDTVPIPAETYRKIPVRGMAQLGDNGHFCDIEYPVGHGDGYLVFPTTDPDAYGLRCNGDSMRPRVKHGEFVIIEPNRRVTNGDEVLVVSQDGRVMIKELAYVRDGIVTLTSVNERHGNLRIPQDQIERLQYVAGILKSSAWRPD